MDIKEELQFCIKLWEEQGYCSFGHKTKCSECGAPYLLYKLLTKKVLHQENKRFNLEEWKEMINQDLEIEV